MDDATIAAFRGERDMREQNYRRELERGIELLQSHLGRRPTDHAGHNLAAVACAISVAAARFEAACAALRYFGEV